MTGAAWAAAAVFAVLAVADWAAVARDHRRAEYVFKPATLAALVAMALVLDAADGSRQAWFVVALVLSLAGDVFLMLPSDRFVQGLGSFLLAHLAYTVGLNLDGGTVLALAVSGLLVAAVAVPLGARVTRGARAQDPRLGVPVTLYVVVISAMVVSALATGSAWAIAGAVLFYASDALIGWSRFVGNVPGHRLAIMATYHLGQGALVVSLLS